MRVTIVATLITLDLLCAAIWVVDGEPMSRESECAAVLQPESTIAASPCFRAPIRVAPIAASRLPRPKVPGRVERIRVPVVRPAERAAEGSEALPPVRKQPRHGASCFGPLDAGGPGHPGFNSGPPTNPAGSRP